MTLQEIDLRVRTLVEEYCPASITFKRVEVGTKLVDGVGQASAYIYLSEGGFHKATLSHTFQASSVERLLRKVAEELEDLFQPQTLETITL